MQETKERSLDQFDIGEIWAEAIWLACESIVTVVTLQKQLLPPPIYQASFKMTQPFPPVILKSIYMALFITQ